MLNMVKKNGVALPREGTASAVREAALSGAVESPSTPARPKRRAFTAAYKQRVLREADAAAASGQDGAIGELLRREGLYSSHLTEWRRARDAGELAGLTPQKRGRKPSKPALADEIARLQRQVAKLEQDLYKANTIVDVQKKLASLLGETLPEPTAEDFARGPESSRRRR
jgi:transposase-like protein